MRGYIFTEHERKILGEWLRSGIELQGIRVLFTRIRQSKKLREDIELYRSIQKKIVTE